ncbi:MAG: hypothetical protein F9K22_11590 [Bacteroidetes bacterium]|nr:MAG: hypothetical protein F9K22_11590 [Bacteroidota bacterium]
MKRSLTFFVCAGLLAIGSCSTDSDSNEYDSVWRPFAQTAWKLSGSPAEGFKATTGGFSFTASIADTGTYTYTFIPDIYVVSNMTTASGATLSFRSAIVNGRDTLTMAAGGTQYHTFGALSGAVRTKGADSVLSAPITFAGDASASLALSVNPDACSREVRFVVTVSWVPFTGGATVGALPKSKKLTVEFTDIEMRVTGIDLQSE